MIALAGSALLVTLTACATTGSPTDDAAAPPRPATSGSFAGSDATSPTPRWPDSLVVLGHSGATGQNSDPAQHGTDAPQNSWATGTNPTVNSVYLRILAHNPAIKGHATNLAKDGATVADLLPQALQALNLTPQPDLFLIQTVDNDIRCDGTDPQNYVTFTATLTSTLRVISNNDPHARIFLVTQPGNVANNAAVAATNPAWVRAWQGNGPCDAFDHTGKLTPGHVAALQDITDHYFAAQSASCTHIPNCTDDRRAWQKMVVTPADFSDDGNHPSITGMAKRAEATWAALQATGTLPSSP